ncbi:MAG: MFS transporter, partial [Pseudomonadota bacterium]
MQTSTTQAAVAEASEHQSTPEHQAYQSKHYRYTVLGLLMLVYLFSFVDRQIVNILGSYIIEDLQLSDAQFGALTGIAFAAIYVTVGIPVARVADRGNRRNVVAISLTIWSLMTAVCGAVQNFWQLFLARAGVGVGEAGCSPPSHSMISDIFPASERSTALSIYSLGIYGGVLVGYVLGGYLAASYGWRLAFVAVGLPGVLLAVIVRMVVKEPPRGMAEAKTVSDDSPAFMEALRFLWSRASFKHIALGCALHAFVSYGLGSFVPVFLVRVHQMPIADIGLWLGVVSGVGGLLGAFGGGYLADRLTNRNGDVRWQLWIPMISTVVTIPFYLLTFLVIENPYYVVLSAFIPSVAGGMYLAPCIS